MIRLDAVCVITFSMLLVIYCKLFRDKDMPWKRNVYRPTGGHSVGRKRSSIAGCATRHPGRRPAGSKIRESPYGRLRPSARRSSIAGRQHTSARLIRVCFACPPDFDWEEVVIHMLKNASEPDIVQFGVNVLCNTIEDALVPVKQDSLFRKFVNVVHDTHIERTNYTHITRRLTKMFVAGNETLVLFLDPRVRVLWNWDAHISSMELATDDLVSVPCSATSASFPTVVLSSDGTMQRGANVAFRMSAAPEDISSVLPSVCWCTEFFWGRPSTFATWPRKDANMLSEMKKKRLLVPVATILHSDADLELALFDTMRQVKLLDVSSSAPQRYTLKMGLSGKPSSNECYHKYGSVRAARLALKLAKKNK